MQTEALAVFNSLKAVLLYQSVGQITVKPSGNDITQ